jgi:hypothetical protein
MPDDSELRKVADVIAAVIMRNDSATDIAHHANAARQTS